MQQHADMSSAMMASSEDDFFGHLDNMGDLFAYDDEEDFFGLPLEPLTDFDSVDLEESEIDAFMEEFEAAAGALADFDLDIFDCVVDHDDLLTAGTHTSSSSTHSHRSQCSDRNSSSREKSEKSARCRTNSFVSPNTNLEESNSDSIEIGTVTIQISSKMTSSSNNSNRKSKQSIDQNHHRIAGHGSIGRPIIRRGKKSKNKMGAGISLLAKPSSHKPPVQAVKSASKSSSNSPGQIVSKSSYNLTAGRGERISPARFATYFYQDHNYLLFNNKP